MRSDYRIKAILFYLNVIKEVFRFHTIRKLNGISCPLAKHHCIYVMAKRQFILDVALALTDVRLKGVRGFAIQTMLRNYRKYEGANFISS